MIVLQFIPSLNKYDGGTTTYMQQLSESLGKSVDLHICALTPISDFAKLENCTLHNLPLHFWHWSIMKQQWLRLLNELNPDVVHFNCCWMPQIALIIRWTKQWKKSTKRKDVMTLLTPHGMLEPWIMKRNYWTRKLPAIILYQRSALKNVDYVIATAENEAANLKHLGWNKNIVMIENGIAVNEIEQKTDCRNRKRLLFMSRLHPKKGLEMLFKVLDSLRNEGYYFTLKIAGEGDAVYTRKLQQTSTDGVTFVGAVYGDEKWKLIREADLVVLPSYSENYGLIVAEALASGTPVLTTHGTPWRSISSRKAGWWVTPNEIDIKKALKEFAQLTDDELSSFSSNARLLAEEECNIDNTAQKLLNLYTKTVS